MVVRRYLLPVVLFSALAAAPVPTTGPAAVGSPPILVEARRVLSSFRASRYSHKTDIDARAGSYYCDCSGFVGYLLKRAEPESYGVLPHRPGKRPLAIHFYTAISGAVPVEEAGQGGGGSSGVAGWERVVRLQDARPGDVLAWRRVEQVKGQDTGHVVLIDSVPVADGGERTYRVTVIDSTGSRHAEDSRAAGQSGVGRGTMWFDVDEAGRPVGYHWRSSERKGTAVPMAIGRPVG